MSIKYDEWVKEINKLEPGTRFYKERTDIQDFIITYRGRGYRDHQISDILKISQSTVYKIRKSMGE